MPLERYRSIIPDWEDFLRVIRTPEPVHLRIRRGRADPDDVVRDLEAQGFRLAPLDQPDDLYRVDEAPFSAGNALEHWLGLYYVQQAVTALAAPALDPRPGERVLDMAAAPGGKTTHLADRMEDRGALVACDPSEKRLRALLANVYRTAHPNVLVLASDARKLGGSELFDRVLLDAPCSGEGTSRKRGGEPRVPPASYLEHIIGLQRGLLRRGLDLLRPGGVLLYVTCTFNPDENEAIVHRILEEREGELEVEPIELDVPHAPGLTAFEGADFHPDLERAWRVYPHHLDSGGLFMCRLRKRDGESPGAAGGSWEAVPVAFPGESDEEEARARVERGLTDLRDVWGVGRDDLRDTRWMVRGDSIWVTTAAEWAPVLWEGEERARVLCLGLRGMKDDPRVGLRPTNDLLQWLGDRLERSVVEPDAGAWRRLLERRELEVPGLRDGFVVLRFRGHTLGRGLIRDGRLRHEVPKAHASRLRDALEAERE